MRAAQEIDAALAPLLDDAERTGVTTLVLSEYGITDADQPVDINRMLRRSGLLEVYTQDGMEYLDPWTSRAFAVADHQVAHVYVDDPADLETVRGAVRRAPRRRPGARPRARRRRTASTTSAPATSCSSPTPTAWFTYYYWLDDARAPDFARGVEIHRKPGYDPAELFFDPEDQVGQAQGRAHPRAGRWPGCGTR